MCATWRQFSWRPTARVARDQCEQVRCRAAARARRLAGAGQARRHQCRRHRRTHHRAAGDAQGQVVPEDIAVEVTRNYGETANEKANELLFHLGLATISIVILVAVAIGWREALVVAIVIPTTILLTLFAARVMGYTLNRVSLFALIFSIGILVDDAIVVIENIARHWAMNDGRSRAAGSNRRRGRGRQSRPSSRRSPWSRPCSPCSSSRA